MQAICEQKPDCKDYKPLSIYGQTKLDGELAVAMGHAENDAEHLTVTSVSTEEYGISKAKRPFNSRLDESKLAENGFDTLPMWQDLLARYLKEIEF